MCKGLDNNDRILVENIKKAKTIRITINEGTGYEAQIYMDADRHPIKELTFKVGLAIQDYFRNAKRQ